MSDMRLFIPGPIQIPESTLEAMHRPMVGHRSSEYGRLHAGVVEKLREVLGSREAMPLLMTCSASGVMEAGIRNLVRRRVLNLVCGAFSERWHRISLACGREAVAERVEWGEAIRAERVREVLSEDSEFDAVTLVHNETSTGVMNDLPAIARAVREVGGDRVCLLVDAVTSMTAVPTPVDELGIDLCLAGTQKAFALPPGLSVAVVSERALARTEEVPDRGMYLDFAGAAKSAVKDQTPFTPAISLIYGLEHSLELMLAEGMETRYQRHLQLAAIARNWTRENLTLFPAEQDCSVTLTVVRAGETDVAGLLAFLRERGVVLANGYGKLKGQTFRIGHMGELRGAELEEVLGWMGEFLRRS